MATLQNIRKRGPLIAVVIGIALLAFIVGDMAKSGDAMFGGNKNNIAEINGNALTYQEYEQQINTTTQYVKDIQNTNTIDDQTNNQIRTSVWETFVRDYVLEKAIKSLGIGVHESEFEDMLFGAHISPTIMRTFTDQTTGQLNLEQLNGFLDQRKENPKFQRIWFYMEEEMIETRIFTKYVNMVQKGMYVNSLETKMDFNERGHIVDFSYVAKNYNTVIDSTISVTDDELKKYYQTHTTEFEQEESRSIVYITFDIVASKKDSTDVYDEITLVKDEFTKTKTPEQFVQMKSDTPLDTTYRNPEDFKSFGLDTTLFNSEIGFVYGPYFDNGNYKLVRLLNKAERADSASVRHILIAYDSQKPETKSKAKTVADSLKLELDNGADFTMLVLQHSDDPGSKEKGGLYENFRQGAMVKPFNDFSFNKEVGEIGIVETQFGFHIIEIMSRTELKPQIKVAFLQLVIEPSSETFDNVYATAAKFSGMNNTKDLFDAALKTQNLTPKEAPNLTQATTSIPGLQSAREVVRWAFSAELDEVSPAFDLVDRHVIALLVDSKDNGVATFEQSKEQLEVEVRKKKKAEQFIGEFNGVGSENLDDYATKFGVRVMQARSVSFNAFQVTGMGYEPSVLAMVVMVEKDGFNGPIEGKNGVYVIKTTSVTPAIVPEGKKWEEDQKRMTQALRGRANYQAFNALKKLADIKDNRAKFF